MESRCGHVSILWFGQRVQLGPGYVSGQKIVLSGFHIVGILKF